MTRQWATWNQTWKPRRLACIHMQRNHAPQSTHSEFLKGCPLRGTQIWPGPVVSEKTRIWSTRYLWQMSPSEYKQMLDQCTVPRWQWVYLELVTAWVPSDTTCLASSLGSSRRTAVWISLEVMVECFLVVSQMEELTQRCRSQRSSWSIWPWRRCQCRGDLLQDLLHIDCVALVFLFFLPVLETAFPEPSFGVLTLSGKLNVFFIVKPAGKEKGRTQTSHSSAFEFQHTFSKYMMPK